MTSYFAYNPLTGRRILVGGPTFLALAPRHQRLVLEQLPLGQNARRRIRITEPGLLAQYGYSTKITEARRRAALRAALAAGMNQLRLERRLQALANLNVRQNPSVSAILSADASYVRRS